jgi:hypothetical protein
MGKTKDTRSPKAHWEYHGLCGLRIKPRKVGGKAEWGYAGIIFSYGDFFSNVFCVCELPFYDVFFFYRKA